VFRNVQQQSTVNAEQQELRKARLDFRKDYAEFWRLHLINTNVYDVKTEIACKVAKKGGLKIKGFGLTKLQQLQECGITELRQVVGVCDK
jgi:hypothetical protein